jgi:hypothetical protein
MGLSVVEPRLDAVLSGAKIPSSMQGSHLSALAALGGLEGLGLLGRQFGDVVQCLGNPSGCEGGLIPPDWRQAQVSSHWPFGEPKGSGSLNGGEFVSSSFIQSNTDVGAEQAGEHVAVDERAEIPEHRLDLNALVLREDRLEELLVLI